MVKPDVASVYPSNRFSVAPMLDWTDRHCRYFYRLMSQHTLLYSEMVTTGAIIHGKGDYLGFNGQEHPVALQLGGSNVEDLTRCGVLAQQQGYDAINLNVGCPSDRVQNGRFGACLMAEPELVATCVNTMQAQLDIPVTVKTRIGIDEQDSYEFLEAFINTVADAGCQHFIVHARKAWLKGLSPKQNREVPPLDYERVYQIKSQFSDLDIAINGGIDNFDDIETHLRHLDGVMLGRKVYQDPWILSQVDERLFSGQAFEFTRHQVARQMLPYIQHHVSQGGRFWHVARHMLGLFQGLPGARSWRRQLSENGPKELGDGSELMHKALLSVPEHN